MTNNLSSKKVSLLAPVAEAIDDELAKPLPERENIVLQDISNPKALKRDLAFYKSQFKSDDWNGKFTMWVRKPDKIEIDFHPSTTYNNSFRFQKQSPPDETETGTINIKKKKDIGKGAPETVIRNMTEQEIVELLLVKDPTVYGPALFHIPAIGLAFSLHLENPAKNQSALVTLMDRRGLSWSTENETLKIFRKGIGG